MSTIHLSQKSMEALVEHRRRTGIGRLDECWEGVWHLTDPTGRHQHFAGRIYRIHSEVLADAGRAAVYISINVTDRELDWKQNHRCPDGAVILPSSRGRWIDEAETAFIGGPDMVVEVLSVDDDTYQKFPFYEARGVREILIVDPVTGRPELWRRESGPFVNVAPPLKSVVTGLVYAPGPSGLEVTDPTTGRAWKI